LNADWVDTRVLGSVERLQVDPTEPHAANALLVVNRVLVGAQYPRTRDRLDAHGLTVVAVDLSELAKAEGALTCCSLIVGSLQG
jgi:dimethylargininase